MFSIINNSSFSELVVRNFIGRLILYLLRYSPMFALRLFHFFLILIAAPKEISPYPLPGTRQE